MHEIDCEEKETSLCRRQKFAQTERRTHQTLDNRAPQFLGMRVIRSHILGFSLLISILTRSNANTPPPVQRERGMSLGPLESNQTFC